MTQIFTGTGLGGHGSSLDQLGSFGPKGAAGLGQGGGSVYLNAATGNLLLKQADGFMSDVGLGLDLFQSYNSRGEGGATWRFNFETRLMFEGTPNTAGSIVKRVDEDGHVSSYRYDERLHVYKACDGSTAQLTFENNGWQYQEGTGAVRCNYDTSGQLKSISDRDGHVLSVNYQNGQLASITDNSGKQSITWTFENGLLSDVSFKSDGLLVHHCHYEYDALNRLSRISQNLGDGNTWWVSYDYAGDTTLIGDIRQSDGTSLHIDYDSEGRVIRLVDGEGRTSEYQYHDGETTMLDGMGGEWHYFYDRDNRLTGIDGPSNYHIRYHYDGKHLDSIIEGTQHWQFAYNEAGDCIRVDSPSGEVCERTFDAQHHLISETRFQTFDGQHQAIKPVTSRYVYDEAGHLRFEVSPDGTVTEYRYTSEGLRTSSRVFLNEQINISSSEEINSLSLDELVVWAGKQIQKAISLVTWSYDWRGCLTEERRYTEVDEKGAGVITDDTLISYSSYDASGRLLEKSSPVKDGIKRTWYFYDDLGRLTKTVDNQGHEQRIEYDDVHQQVIKTAANGLQTIELYDRSGLLISRHCIDKGHDYGRISYQYDAMSRLIAETDIEGKTSYFFYDGQGHLKANVIANGQVTEYDYDENGHCVRTRKYQTKADLQKIKANLSDWTKVKPGSTANDRITQMVYNEFGQLAWEIDAEGAVIGYRYDAQNRLTGKTAYANRLADFDTSKQLLPQDIDPKTDELDRSMAWYYDTMGRLQAEINGEGCVIGYRYDKLGHVIEQRKYRNKAASKLTGDWSIDEPASAARDIHQYSIYNAAGLKVADIDAENYLIEYHYDARGLLIKKIARYNGLGENFVLDDKATLESLRPSPHHNDHVIQYSYNDLDQLIEERSNGLIISYDYNEQGFVISKTLEDAKTHEQRQQQHRYDALGRVIQSLDAVGSALLEQNKYASSEQIELIWQQHSIKYTYDKAGRLTSETNALNQQSRFFYDEQGLLAYTLTAAGSITETRYNAFQQVETSIRYSARWTGNTEVSSAELGEFLKNAADDRFDEVTHYEYNHIGLVTSVSKGTTGKLESSYNAFGELDQTSETIGLNLTSITSYQYDRRGLLKTRIEDVAGINKTNNFEYDSAGRLVKSVDGRKGETLFLLNRRGEQICIDDPGRGSNTISYDAFGRILDVTGKNNQSYTYNDQNNTLTVSRVNVAGSVITQFNALGDQISITDGNGHTTLYQYDVQGQLIIVDAPEGASTKYYYNAAGQLEFEENADGHCIRYTWDAEGHMLSKVLDPDGVNRVTTYTYDGIGRQLQVNDGGRVTEFTYDNRGNLINKCLDPDGLNLVTDLTYTENGLLSQQIIRNPNGIDKVIAYTWDALGRCLSTTIDPDGLALSTCYEYDQNGNLVSQTEPGKNRTQFIYDANNRMRYQIDARGVVTEHCYDIYGNELKTVIYANRVSSTISYTSEASLIKSIHADASADQYQFFSFDKQKRLLRSYDSLGYATEYNYDANDNLIDKTICATSCTLDDLLAGIRPKANGSPLDRVTRYVYDSLNQLRFQIGTDGRVTEYTYDHSGKKIKETRFINRVDLTDIKYTISDILTKLPIDAEQDETRNYAYDKAGRLIAESNPSGYVISYHYDEADNLVMSTRHATALSNEQLAKADWAESLKTGAGDRISRFVFDACGRELYRISAEGHVVERRYDANGNVLAEIAHEKSIKAGVLDLKAVQEALGKDTAAEHLTTFEYDVAGRLLAKTDANLQTTSYSYDKNNNVVKKIDANKACWTYKYDEANQLIESISPETTVSTWKNGVLVDEKRAIKTQNVYDSFGNLVKVTRDEGGLNQSTEYRYDTLNRSVATIYPDMMINQAGYAAGNARVENKQTLMETRIYNAFGEVIESKDRAGHSRHWIYDQSGRMVYQLDANNALTLYDYDAFDNVTCKTNYASAYALPKGACLPTDIHPVTNKEHDRHEYNLYDKNHQLIETQKDAVTSYNPRTGEYNQLSPSTRFAYNAFGELVRNEVKLSDVDWAVTRTFYNLDGLKIANLDAENYLTTYSYNSYGWLEEEVQYAARASGDEINITKLAANPKDRKVVFTYDAIGQLSSKTLKNATWQKLNGKGSQYENQTGDLTSSYQYDALGNLVKTTDPLGNTAYSYYNESGQLIAKVGALSQSGRPATSYRYDALGMLVESHQWAAGSIEADETHVKFSVPTNSDIIKQSIYDNAGQLIQQIDGTGHAVNYSYDANGNIARSWQALHQVDGSVLVKDLRYSWDAENHQIQTATLKANGTFATEDTSYNLFGEISARGIDGVMATRFDYDKAGRVWRSNAKGYYQIFIYDLNDHITQVATSTNAYDPEYGYYGVDLSAGKYDQVIRFNEMSLHYDLQRQDNIYDALGRLLVQTKDGSTSALDKHDQIEIKRATQQQKVDRWGNVISHCNANGYTTLYEYNIFNEVSLQTMPEVTVVDEQGVAKRVSPEVHMAYDALGRAIAMMDANKHTVAKLLDAEGRVIQEIDAKGNHRDKEYNLLGQMVSSTNERGATTTYLYDKENRLVSTSTSQGSTTNAYDEAGQLIQTEGAGAITKYWYDALGHQVQKAEAWSGDITTYEYDDAGRKTAEHDANGNSRTWSYDINGRLIAHTDLSGNSTSYTYNTNGMLVTEQSSHGKNMAYKYFSDGLLKQYSDNSRHEVVDYTYDAEGQMLSKESSKIGAWILETDHYQYDELGRLVQVRRRNPDDVSKRFPDTDKSLLFIDYEYDAVGNIRDTKVATNYGNQRQTHEDYFVYDENNRMLVNKGQLQNGQIGMTANQGSQSSYDAAGNIVTAVKYENGEQQHYSYTYNSANLIQKIRKNGIDLQAKVYNEAGLVTSEYRYDNSGLLTQRNQLIYEAGRMTGMITYNQAEVEISRTHYGYDLVGNLIDQNTVVYAQEGSAGSSQSHHYSYQLWDSYQQNTDDALLRVDGHAATEGKTTRMYDVNGQLSDVIDNQGINIIHYLTSSVDGIRARRDSEGQTSYLSVAGKTIGDLRVDKNGVAHLDVYGGFTPTGSGDTSPGAAKELWDKMDADKKNMQSFTQNAKANQEAMPEAPGESYGTYTLHAGDTLENIAMQVYGDSSLWYLIADANGITDRYAYAGEKGSQLHIGQRLNIPPVQGGQRHANGTQKLMNASDVIGNTSAAAPLPPAPPQPKRHHSPWRVVAKIVVAIVATVATVLSAGALGLLTGAIANTTGITLMGAGLSALGGGATSLAASAGIGLTAGFIGSVAAQGAAAAFGLQHGVDFNSALITGLATAATAGVGNLLQGSASYGKLLNAMDKLPHEAFNIRTAAEMMERDALSQSFNLARGHQKFDWLELGISAATAGFMGGEKVQNLGNAMHEKFGKAGSIISSELHALTNNAASSLATGKHFDAGKVLQENLGSAVSSSVLEAKTETDDGELMGMNAFVKGYQKQIMKARFANVASSTLKTADELRVGQEDTWNNEWHDLALPRYMGEVVYDNSSRVTQGKGALISHNENLVVKVPLAIQGDEISRRTIVFKDLKNTTQLPIVEPISDDELTDKNSLTKKQIRAIINKHNPKLLDDRYRADEAIYQATQKYEINPKALLASLQQEQNWGRNGRIDKAMGIGTEAHPLSLKFKDSINKAAAIYRKWFDVGLKNLQDKNPVPLEINLGFKYMPRTAAEYSRFKYTPWTYYKPQGSRPYDQWVTSFRSFK